MADEEQVRDESLCGLVAEFIDEKTLLAATQRARGAGYRDMDAFTPYPVEEIADALDFRRTRVPLVVLIGGILGGAGGFALQYWINVYAYPLNVGGRPLNSWPAFIPVTFETTVLLAGIFAVFGMFWLNGLPEPYHPLFNVAQFGRASQDRFFLYIENSDPNFAYAETRAFLEGLAAEGVYDVPE
ncbi:MAG: DUF3341 domain-containing protein [Caldilineaceae bacterium]|nr:DUF3341 domain-containing protein [Caldilineaceae bacterium]